MTMTKLAWLFATALLVACSGTTTGVGPGADGGSSGGTSSGGDPTCTDTALKGERMCLPGVAKAGAALEIAVDGTGCVACGGTVLPCQVAVSGTTITITATERDCPTNDLCPASCGIPQAKCEIPALAAGTYQVSFASNVQSEDALVRQLVVAADGASSCTLPPGDSPPLQASDFPQSCSGDADCTVVIEGTSCSGCACPNAAIAKSSLADYEAAQREHIAECRSSNAGQGACAPCQQLVAHCNVGKCVASSP